MTIPWLLEGRFIGAHLGVLNGVLLLVDIKSGLRFVYSISFEARGL